MTTPEARESVYATQQARANRAAKDAESADRDPSVRVVDAGGREWARSRNGSWAMLGGLGNVDSLTALSELYGPVEVTRA